MSAALRFGFEGLDGGDDSAPIPAVLLTPARRAAQRGVRLETVIRRYFAGYIVLADFVIQIAQERDVHLEGDELQRIWRAEATRFEHLIAAVSKEYSREVERRGRNLERRQAEQVRRMLAGELVDVELDYELDAWHIAAVASGPGSPRALRELSLALDRRLLLRRPDEGTVWAWLGGRSRLSVREAARLAEHSLPGDVSLALGEPGKGVDGWRLSHRQAIAAMSVARHGGDRIVCYGNVGLLAAALRDSLLADSLHDLYLAPLARERDAGVALRRTLRAYFAAARNISSAAAALAVSRPTVTSRLRTIEERIGRPLDTCTAELETALHLEELSAHHPPELSTG